MVHDTASLPVVSIKDCYFVKNAVCFAGVHAWFFNLNFDFQSVYYS